MKTHIANLYTKVFQPLFTTLVLFLAFSGQVSAQQVLFVVGDTLLDPGDKIIALSLQNQPGLSLEIKDDDGITSSAANGKHLVLISASTSAGKIGTTFTNSPSVVSTFNYELLDDLGMVNPGDVGIHFSNTLKVSDPSYPPSLTAAPVQITYNSHPLTYGLPNSNAAIHTHVPGNTNQALSFSYYSGSQMPGLIAPGDRVSLFMRDPYATLIDLTSIGENILQASFGLANPIQINLTKTFMGRYGSNADAEYKILPTSSGEYRLIGSGQSSTQDWNFHVISIDDLGQQQSATTLLTPDLQEDSESRVNMKTATIATDGDIINTIEGRYWDGTAWAGCISPIIVRMDEDLNVRFIKRLQLGCNVPQALRATQNNGFQLISVDRTQTFIHRFDDQGNVIFSKFLGMGNYLFRDMQLLDDGSAIMVGSNSYPTDPDDYDESMLMVKIDSSGNVLWSKSYSYNDNRISALGLEILASGNIVVIGQYGQNGNSHTMLQIFDPSGTPISGKNLDLGGSSMAYSIVAHPDGGFVVGGGTRSHNFDEREEPFLARFKDDGTLQWMQVYHQDIAPADAKILQFKMTADWGYIISASTGNTGFPGLIIKTDALGQLRGGYQCKSEAITNSQLSEQSILFSDTTESFATIPYSSYTLSSFSHTQQSLSFLPQFPSVCPIELPSCPTVSLEFMDPSSDENYIATYTPRVPVAIPPSSDAKTELQNLDFASELVQQVSYFDGLGRPIQQIAPQAASNGSDVISFIQYDEFGRQTKEFMPYEATGTLGIYQTGNEAAQQSFYGAAFPAYGTTRLFTETQFEASPLNRVLEVAAPGVPWETKSSTVFGQREANEHTVITKYEVNDVDLLGWGINPSIPATGNANYYPVNSLTKTIVFDENDGESIQYVDKLGRTIRSEVDIDGTTTAITQYIYDEFGRVKYVLQPKGYEAVENNSNTLTQAILDNWAFQYEYDERGRVSRKRVPGAGWVTLVYNQLDQLVLTQDANQDTSNQWLYTKYDGLGRPIETGLYSSPDDRSTLQTAIYGLPPFEGRQAGNDGYSNTAFPTDAGREKLSITYYDDYDFDYDGTPDHQYLAGSPNEKSRGFITGVKTKVLDSSPEKWLLTLTFYDDYGRELETRAEHLHGTDIVKYQLNFIGEIEKTITEHSGPNATDITQSREYCYDHNGRLLRVVSQVNNDNPVVLASYNYDVLGRQQTKNLHSKDGLTFLQNVDYGYNIRGWMTGLNEIPTAEDLFEMKLSYNDNPVDIGGAGADMFNGNISGMSWKTALDTEEHGYSFSYDKLNRLEDAKYGAGTTYSQNQTRYDVSLAYDKNGNIQGLKREGKSSNTAFGLMDSLTYKYDEGNRLARVYDNAGSDAEVEQFFDGNTSGDDYIYDANGNIIEDKNKDITIVYNHLNKPTLITLTGGTIAYVYDAAGTKLQQIVNDGSTKTNDYISGVQYENNVLKFFAHEEGRLVPDGSISEYRYEYNLTDHLGNVRVTFSDMDDDGTIQTASEVLQTDHYYPFGMRMAMDGGASVVASPPNKFLYNGKELQTDLDLNWYDYGARMYDASIARWNGVDPSAEKYESINPYSYAFNNPTRFIDIKGRDPGDVVVIFAGGDLSSDRGLGSTGEIVQKLQEQYFNEFGGSVSNFPSPYWSSQTYHGYAGVVAGASTTLIEGELDEATQEAYDYILDNQEDGGRVIVYGYSYGGVLATHLEKRLRQNNIRVNLLVTVDAAAGPHSNQVDRTISNNTDENINIYQETPSSIGSRGAGNTREDGSMRKISNRIKVNVLDENGNRKRITHSTIDETSVGEVIQEILNRLQKQEDRKNRREERREERRNRNN